MSTESTGTSSFDDDNADSSAFSPSPHKRFRAGEMDRGLEMDDDDPDIDAVLAAESDSDGELNDRIVISQKLKKGDVVWKLELASMKGDRHINARNVKEEDFNRSADDFTTEKEIIRVKMYVVKTPRCSTTNKADKRASLMPVFNKSDFSDSSRINIKNLQNEKIKLSRIFKYQHNRDINKRILGAVERSVQWAMKISPEKRKEYEGYLADITRMEELVRDYFGLQDRDQVDPLDFLIRDNVDRQRKYPQLTRKLKASVIHFVRKERAAAEAAAKGESGGGETEASPSAADDVIEIPEGDLDQILSDMVQEREQHLGGNVVGEVVDVTDSPRSCDIDETPPVVEEPLCPERQRQQTMSQKIMDELNRGDYDEYITTIVTGKNKGRRHNHFVKIQHSENPDFHPITSKLGKWCNLGFLSEDEDLEFANITRHKLQQKRDLLVLSEESKANSNLMEKYLTLVLQPELLIKIVLKRKRRTEGPKAKIKAAENFYLERRVTDLEVARFEEQVDREIMESRSSRRSSTGSPYLDDDDEDMDGEES